jgi:hypothetical protein
LDVAIAEQVYQYLAPSAVRSIGRQMEVVLATSGGNVEGAPASHPIFFDGFLNQPEETALGLLACARVARTRYFTQRSGSGTLCSTAWLPNVLMPTCSAPTCRRTG